MRLMWEQMLAFTDDQNAASAPINSREWKSQFGKSNLSPPQKLKLLSEAETQKARLDQVHHFCIQLSQYQNEFKHLVDDPNLTPLQKYICICSG